MMILGTCQKKYLYSSYVLPRGLDLSHISNIINVLAHTFLLPTLEKGVGGFVDISMSYRISNQLVKPIVAFFVLILAACLAEPPS
jgi:hypothetical protein